MKQRFIFRKKKRLKKAFTIVFLLIIIIIYLIFNLLNNSKYKITNKDISTLLYNISFSKEYNLEKRKNVISAFKNNYEFIHSIKINKIEKETIKDPIIYLYNSHQSEQYSAYNLFDINLNPTVIVGSYILKDYFKDNNINSIVEERSIKEILNKNKWRYYMSYNASRILMEDARNKNPSLKYFIDIHRDSLKKNRTTITINGKNYAKTMFLIGLENKNYKENLEFTEKINNKMNELYPSLSKGIYKKGGPGVNGVYNQDFSNRTILIEVGGYENTIDEVLNSITAFGKCFLEVIKDEI